MDGVVDLGDWLVEHRVGLDRGEADWLERLAEFDRDALWSLDGHFSCASWLVWRTNMKRSTAFEKIRVAHELSRRPIVAEAFRTGRISYSATRAITRMERPDPEVDEAMVGLAASGEASIIDVERAVRSYMLHADQDKAPPDPDFKRDVRVHRREDGTGQVVVTLSDLELEEFVAALQAFIDLRYRPTPVDESSREDCPEPEGGLDLFGPVDESSRGDCPEPDGGFRDFVPADPSLLGDFRFYPQPIDGEAPMEQAGRPAQKANAFLDMVNSALAGADGGRAAGDDRYLVHVVTRDDGRSFSFLDGAPLHPADAAAMTCGCSSVTHTVNAAGEPLHLGRKTREWSTAQRRAIAVRDGGQCRFPGCEFTHYDIHHMVAWEAGGLTDVDNGFCLCRRHHRMLHAGYQVEGTPNGELSFSRPGGRYIDSTYPASSRVFRPLVDSR